MGGTAKPQGLPLGPKFWQAKWSKWEATATGSAKWRHAFAFSAAHESAQTTTHSASHAHFHQLLHGLLALLKTLNEFIYF